MVDTRAAQARRHRLSPVVRLTRPDQNKTGRLIQAAGYRVLRLLGAYQTATGLPGEPVPPIMRSGAHTNKNS